MPSKMPSSSRRRGVRKVKAELHDGAMLHTHCLCKMRPLGVFVFAAVLGREEAAAIHPLSLCMVHDGSVS